MDVVNLVVMGKTGAGKSTLINSVLEEDLAPTGSGQAVTRENCVYSRKMLVSVEREALKNADYSQVAKEVKMYDTVGLEIDSAITQSTLKEIEELIRKAQNRERENDVTLVWFCVNWRSSRFEDYEVQLIRSMSVENEIPFVLVLTQCYANEESELEERIRREFSEIPVVRVLAKDYSLRNGVIEAYGVKELLARSVSDYNSCKVRILEDKLQRLTRNRENTIDRIRVLGNSCIASHSQKAKKIGRIPVGCIPFVHGLCIEMITELNRIARLNSSKRFAQQLFENVVVAAIVTPAMIFPILSAAAAPAYIETVGETYLDSLIDAISCSTNKDLQDSDLMAARIKAEIKKRKK